jgi:hypothetical protein
MHDGHALWKTARRTTAQYGLMTRLDKVQLTPYRHFT